MKRLVRYLVFGVVGVVFAASGVFAARGATKAAVAPAAASVPELILTWQAQNYAPASYEGKRLPTGNTIIAAAVELIDGGKVINLSNNVLHF